MCVNWLIAHQVNTHFGTKLSFMTPLCTVRLFSKSCAWSSNLTFFSGLSRWSSKNLSLKATEESELLQRALQASSQRNPALRGTGAMTAFPPSWSPCCFDFLQAQWDLFGVV